MGYKHYNKFDVCYKYNTPKDFRDKNPINGSLNAEYWHNTSKIMITDVSFYFHPLKATYSYIDLNSGTRGAWTSNEFLKFIRKGTIEEYIEIYKIRNEII